MGLSLSERKEKVVVYSVSSEMMVIALSTRGFLGMTKMPLLPIRKLPVVSSIGQVS